MLVHLVSDRFATGGGIEHILQIAKALPAIRFRVFAAPGDAAGRFSGLANVEVAPKGYRPALVMRGRPDLIHIHHLRPLLAFFLNPLAAYDVPVLFTAHGLHLHKYEFIPGLRGRLGFALRFTLEKYLLRRVRQVIAVSREDRDFLAGRYGLARVRHIANSVVLPPGEVGADRRELAREFRLPEPGTLFLTVARFNFQKGQDVLLRAVAIARDAIAAANARFLLAGDGGTLPAMKKLASGLGISHLVRFLGDRPDARRLMRACDVMILPSRWEGLPLALLEAGLMKVPVIAADTYGNAELLANGRGITFAPGSAPDLAGKISGVLGGGLDPARGVESLSQFIRSDYGIAGFAAALRDTYEAALGGKNEPGRD